MKPEVERAKYLVNKFGEELALKVVDEMIGECRHWLTSDKRKRVYWEEKRLDYLAEVKHELFKQQEQ